jgi:hypothetical protein
MHEEKWLLFLEHDPVSPLVSLEHTGKGFSAKDEKI